MAKATTAAPEADPTIQLGNYADSGLYGQVYKGRQDPPGRDVAIKIINPEHGAAFDATQHARGLVRAGAHPNIVTVHVVTKVRHPETKELVDAVVMEWLDGKSLGHRLGQSPRITVDEARAICDGLISGVKHLHDNGVTHTDLHIGNVILTVHGPRIIDIDYSSAKSLAMLTTLAKAHQINADITQLAGLLLMTFRRSLVRHDHYAAHEDRLRDATTIAEIEQLVDVMLDNTADESQTTAETRTTNVLPEETFERAVEDALEQGKQTTLRRLIMPPVNELAEKLASEKYAVQDLLNIDGLRERVTEYRNDSSPIIPALGLLGYWGGAEVNLLTVEAIDRIANAHEKNPLPNGKKNLIALREYPTIAAVYAAGIGAIAHDNYKALFAVLRDTVHYKYGQERMKLWTELAFWTAETRDLWNQVLGRDLYFPISQVLEEDMREPFSHLLPSDTRFREKYVRFEMFASFEHFLTVGRALGSGFVISGYREGQRQDLLADVQQEAREAGDDWKPLKAGLLSQSSYDDVNKALEEFRKSVQEVRGAYHVF